MMMNPRLRRALIVAKPWATGVFWGLMMVFFVVMVASRGNPFGI